MYLHGVFAWGICMGYLYGDEIHGWRLMPRVLLIHCLTINYPWSYYSFVAISIYYLAVSMS